MNCAEHNEVTATAFCRECGKAMCPDCQRPALGSVYCATHLPVTAPPSSQTASPYTAPVYTTPPVASPYTAPAGTAIGIPDDTVHPVLALLLGFIPGVGAIYN